MVTMTWQPVLSIIPLGIAVIALIIAMVQSRRLAFIDITSEENYGTRINQLENDVSTLAGSIVDVNNKIKNVEIDFKAPIQQRQNQESQQSESDISESPYNQAVLLANNGADVDELIESCGLSRAEAELVEMLHKNRLND